ncbi:MAG: hypothetical protein F9K38_15395, partial [Pseudorhodoplanes sp.]
HARCARLAFVERPFMGRPSASILFFNIDGGIVFKVFVGRDENRELKADQLRKFRALAGKLAARPHAWAAACEHAPAAAPARQRLT